MTSLLMLGRLRISGSIIGSPSQMQRMLDFADRNRIRPWTQSFPLAEVNSALACLRQGRVRYRAVLTMT